MAAPGKCRHHPFALVYPDFRAAYIKVNKCATQTLTQAFAEVLAGSAGPGAVLTGTFPAGYFVFAFVRNPYDRLVSTYFNQVARPTKFSRGLFRDGMHKAFWRYDGMHPGMGFSDFAHLVAGIRDNLANPHFKSQADFLTDDLTGDLMPGFIGRFEQLQADFDWICHRLGADTVRLPVLNRSARNLWPHYYTRELADVVYRRFQADFELFGYSRKIPC